MKIKRLLKALFHPRVQDPLGGYIKSIPVIQKLIERDMLYVDVRKPYIALSLELHMCYMDDEVKLSAFPYSLLDRMGLIERDRAYKNFLERIRAYINFHRSRLGIPVIPSTKRLDFLVMNIEKSNPLLIGYYEDGVLDYKTVKEEIDV